ncbi:hypothetical protein G4G28_03680 [Massilia sp. Dwa41.01b]|uniref:hypothetical protein n=1 Tax=unclassified Massilia TaxID=2609279 RepID=UPI00160440D3|nr:MULTISPECIES: hypothetical protein [unclassified Massilia]QNA87797.1 hypothetical protein G4G28_03680 [Massilia sp. Dwa41.01b]QNA98698.1 hypothetical protein G4G31_07400 [Massilia sp. Se16.2.3]
MRHALFALPLAALLLTSSASAGQTYSLSEASVGASAIVVLVPLSVVVVGSQAIANTVDELSSRKRWHVTEIEPQGRNTTVRMCSDDDKVTLDMNVPAATARTHALQAGDALEMERVGKAGFAVRKGQATVGVLSDPGAGMVHSKARS